jgi:hypothetical protein
LAIVLSVLLRFTDSDYPFDIFKLFIYYIFATIFLIYVNKLSVEYKRTFFYNKEYIEGIPFNSLMKGGKISATIYPFVSPIFMVSTTEKYVLRI